MEYKITFKWGRLIAGKIGNDFFVPDFSCEG